MLTLLSHPAIPYVLPFAVFLFLTELARWVPNSLLWVYPVKTTVTGGLLLWFRKTYSEIKPDFSLLAIAVGVVVFLLWIPLYGGYLLLSEPQIVNPYELAGSLALPWIAIRLLGSSIVVPVMEELFWRSFLMRWIEKSDFEAVDPVQIGLRSFVFTVVLFGFEHNLWLAGILSSVRGKK